MIPSLYFDYLEDGDARPLKGVFYHNAVDVLSMAALLNHIAAQLADPLGGHRSPLDQVDMGRLFEDLGHVETAAQLYERALVHDLPDDIRVRTVRQWSFLEKRRDNLSEAMRLWHEAAANGELYAHVELAKVYEHRMHNYQGAIFWTQLALDRIAEPSRSPAERLRWVSELNHRLARVQRKLEKEARDGSG
jgi:tetratricopeptide (TPR) repeat protein